MNDFSLVYTVIFSSVIFGNQFLLVVPFLIEMLNDEAPQSISLIPFPFISNVFDLVFASGLCSYCAICCIDEAPPTR